MPPRIVDSIISFNLAIEILIVDTTHLLAVVLAFNSFNLVIEILIVDTHQQTENLWRCMTRFNLVIEILIVDTSVTVYRVVIVPDLFQSRDRDSYS